MVFAVSVTVKRTVTPSASRLTLPGSTMPPMRKVRPCGASFAATSDGVKKNTRFLLNAVRVSAVATPSAATPSAMRAIRLCLGFTLPLQQQDHFQREQREGHHVRAPHVESVVLHSPLSRMMQRTRNKVTAMLYIQNASAISSIPVSICAAMVGAFVRLTDAPWCSV